jgi:branched-subunit amino acid ABC-type transport system permease component
MSGHSPAYYAVAAIGLVALLIDLFGDGDQQWATIVVIVCIVLLVLLRPGGLMKRMGGRS